MIPNFQFCS